MSKRQNVKPRKANVQSRVHRFDGSNKLSFNAPLPMIITLMKNMRRVIQRVIKSPLSPMKSHDESHAAILRKREENKKQFRDFMFSCLRNKEKQPKKESRAIFELK